MTVAFLIKMLQKLPQDTRIYTSGLEGVYPAELGNLFPLKVMQTKFCCALYIDDGISHNEITKDWQPLDEFIAVTGLIQ